MAKIRGVNDEWRGVEYALTPGAALVIADAVPARAGSQKPAGPEKSGATAGLS